MSTNEVLYLDQSISLRLQLSDGSNSDFNEARAEVFDALGHPTRIKVLQALGQRPLSFSELKKEVGIESSGHMAFHLGWLNHLLGTERRESWT